MMNVTELRKRLLNQTAVGSATQWVQRLEMLAEDMKLEKSRICWQGSPEVVAHNIAKEAIQSDKVNLFVQLFGV